MSKFTACQLWKVVVLFGVLVVLGAGVLGACWRGNANGAGKPNESRNANPGSAPAYVDKMRFLVG